MERGRKMEQAAQQINQIDLEHLTDEETVNLAQYGNVIALEHLINKYKNFVRAKARTYFLIGGDREDIIQEGMIGLYKAIRDYRCERQASFRAFAEICVTRQMITAIKMATRQKHIPLNSYVSLNKPVFDEESERTLGEVVVVQTERSGNPEELFIHQENLLDIETDRKSVV